MLLLSDLLFSGCRRADTESNKREPSAPAATRTVRVAAASDLKFALADVIAAFEVAHPEAHVEATYGSSGNFFAQLSNKAPFDLYLSADISYPRQLIQAGLALPESEFLYAHGQIVLWARQAAPFDVTQLGLDSLQQPSVRKIAIANPAHAPYGRAAEAALKSLGVYDQVRERLVLGDNIAQTAQFVESGGADIGIIALSLALAPSMQEQGHFWTIPRDAYPPLEQGGVILNWAQDRRLAEAFRSFLLEPRGREILDRFGFEAAKE
jgi:molybdate transport system substrate-binding protein